MGISLPTTLLPDFGLSSPIYARSPVLCFPPIFLCLSRLGGCADFAHRVRAPEGITVDGLGFWDYQSDGFYLGQTFPVGLWDATGALLRSTTITASAGLRASLHPSGGWRVSAVSQVLLAPGLYRIGALMPVSGANQIVAFAATVQTVPGVTVTHRRPRALLPD